VLVRVRKLGTGTLSWGAGHVDGGQEASIPYGVAIRYAHRLEFLEDMPQPDPSISLDVTEYHVGGGWYELPGHDGRVRRVEALRLLGLEGA
jgi:hypothetical protein